MPDAYQVGIWRQAVANGSTTLGLDDWWKHDLSRTVSPPDRKRYSVEGQVFLADSFNYEVYAESRPDAEKKARERAREATWNEAEIQEVCIQSAEEF